MNLLRRHLQALSSVALLAMVTLALLPTLVQAMAQLRGGHALTEVCTPQGMKLVVADVGEQVVPVDAARSARAHLDHCPFCATAAHAIAPPTLVTLRLLPTEVPDAAARTLQAPRRLHAWAVAPPRGPPLLA